MPPPIVAATWPFSAPGAAEAGARLAAGAALGEALAAGLGVIEEDPATGGYFVGVGGLPNAEGVIQMDAAVMDGAACRFGAVCALEEFVLRRRPALLPAVLLLLPDMQLCFTPDRLCSIATPTAVALRVLEASPHSMLVGHGARDFACSQGFTPRDVSTPDSRAAYDRFLATKQAPKSHDTCSMVAADGIGNVAAAVSTSGMSFKASGRVGDSPLPGSGLYADNDGGAAVCSGEGDKILRFCPAYRAVCLMAEGMSPSEACHKVLHGIANRLARAGEPMFEMVLLAINPAGEVGAASSCGNWHDHILNQNYPGFPYSYWKGPESEFLSEVAEIRVEPDTLPEEHKSAAAILASKVFPSAH
eukprot:m.101933 g.101933  ORF g.101933 m.101933 type:complete len:360 (-) comp8981_c0_seq4:1536-2615(-)